MKKEVSYGHVLRKTDDGYFFTVTDDQKEILKKLAIVVRRYEKNIEVSSPELVNGQYLTRVSGTKKIYGYKTLNGGFYDTYNEQYFESSTLDLWKLINEMDITEENGTITRDKSLVIDHSLVTYNRTLNLGTLFDPQMHYGYEIIGHNFYDTYNEEYYNSAYLMKNGYPIRREKGFIPIAKRDSNVRAFIKNGTENMQLVYKKFKSLIK